MCAKLKVQSSKFRGSSRDRISSFTQCGVHRFFDSSQNSGERALAKLNAVGVLRNSALSLFHELGAWSLKFPLSFELYPLRFLRRGSARLTQPCSSLAPLSQK